MSRVATPTDDPIIEALNGWMKEERTLDFGLSDTNGLPKLLDSCVYYFNNLNNLRLAARWTAETQFSTELNWASDPLGVFPICFLLR